MKKRKDNEQTLKDAIADFLKVEKLDTKLAEVKIINQWENLVGKLIASQTEKIFFHQGKLFLHITSPPLKAELNYQRFKIVELVNKEAGVELIKDVVIR